MKLSVIVVSNGSAVKLTSQSTSTSGAVVVAVTLCALQVFPASSEEIGTMTFLYEPGAIPPPKLSIQTLPSV